MNAMIDTYQKHKNLKLAANELGMNWHVLYSHLRRAGVQVTGDKARYGSPTDKLSAAAEREFMKLVPSAISQNDIEFQEKVDFVVSGYSVDVKAGRPFQGNKRYPALRWAFCIKKQTFSADFFVCFALEEGRSPRVLLIPGELVRGISTLSISRGGKSKWFDYEVNPADMADFFASLPVKLGHQGTLA